MAVTCRIEHAEGGTAELSDSSISPASCGQRHYMIIADCGCEPKMLLALWEARRKADVVIAGTVPVSFAEGMRNKLVAWALSLPVKNPFPSALITGGSASDEALRAPNDWFPPGILTRTLAQGFRVAEEPCPSGYVSGSGALSGRADISKLLKLWSYRNSIDSADYDYRAFFSRIPMQRYWQRRRVAITVALAGPPGRTLDIGCGSSVILGRFPGAIGLDASMKKLRFQAGLGNSTVRADIASLPFPDASFDTVICSQVIEHVPKSPAILDELSRVIAPGGRLLLGTPDYGRAQWRIIESLYRKFQPRGYADEHISHYDLEEVRREMESRGMKMDCARYIMGAELICRFLKP
ncbi:MAG TPA: methyltransferase domain-containing protein [Candidatus Brocadiia bacterium]|nr:methyltransferase domain-containing protein [Candidatus Brocadiia bacterium]